MTLIDRLAEEVTKNREPFVIKMTAEDAGRRSDYHFFQNQTGKARYVYGISDYQGENACADLSGKPELVAIVTAGKVYIVNAWFLEVNQYGSEKTVLPENTVLLTDYVKEQNNYVKDVIFPVFYSGLEADGEMPDTLNKECREKARKILLTRETGWENAGPEDLFKKQDAANILCGFMDMKAEAETRLNCRKNMWIIKKASKEKTREFLNASDTVLPWEKELADGLGMVDAKLVIAEFEKDGQKDSAKISPQKVLMKLIREDAFDGYDFDVARKGEELIRKLGVKRWGGNADALRCSHISRITYGKKELYTRLEQEKCEHDERSDGMN